MRIAFAGTPEFAKLQLEALLREHHSIVVVYTQPDKPVGRGRQIQFNPVKQLALAHNLPIEQPTHLKSQAALATLQSYHPDLLIVAAFGMILPSTILQVPRYGCINIHASLLPRWRGATPIQQAILAGDQSTGITFMQMNERLDEGDILHTLSCPIDANETTLSLEKKLAHLAAPYLAKNLSALVHMPKLPQGTSNTSYAPKIRKEEAALDWNQKASILEKQIRAYTPWPIAFGLFQRQVLRIYEACVVPLSEPAFPGTIVAHHKTGLVVATAQDALLITRAQLPGKKQMPFSEILKGHHELFAIGQRFDEKTK